MIADLYDFDKTVFNGESGSEFWLFCLKRHPRIIKYLPKQLKGLLGHFVFHSMLAHRFPVDLHPRAVVHGLGEMVDTLLKVHLTPVDVGGVILHPEDIGVVFHLFRRVETERRVRDGGPVRPVRLARHRADLESGLPFGAKPRRSRHDKTHKNEPFAKSEFFSFIPPHDLK